MNLIYGFDDLENYQEGFTVSADKLKRYLIDNYDALKKLGIDDFPDNTNAIKAMSQNDIINLSSKARKKIDSEINVKVDNDPFTLEAKKKFLKKYTDTDFSDSNKRIEFIKNLSDEELLILNQFNGNVTGFLSRDFIIRELSRQKLSLQDTIGLSNSDLLSDKSLITLANREAFIKRYDGSITDLAKKKQFINSLSPEELVLTAGTGLKSKASLLREIETKENQSKTLDEILGINAEGANNLYLQNLTEEPDKQYIINKLIDPDIRKKLEAGKNMTKISSQPFAHNSKQANIYQLGDGVFGHYGYLVDSGGKYEFYRNQRELLGLPEEISNDNNKFIRLATEGWGINYNTDKQTYEASSLLRLSQNAGRLTNRDENLSNTLHTILEKIYASEEKAQGANEETTKWHKEMKRRVAKLLMSSSNQEFIKNREEFQKYLDDTYSGIDGWNIIHIDGWRREFNSADAQTENMLREVRVLLDLGVDE